MFSISTFVSAMVLLSGLAGSSGYTYVCNDDNSIEVSGLPETSVSFFAYQGSTVCSTSGDNVHLTITGCSKDVPIVLAHGSYVEMPNKKILGGLEIQTLDILCEEISTAGVYHSINNSFAPSVSHYQEVTIAPTYNVSSELNITTATVGEPILWTIHYPGAYYLQITNCKAYPGTSSGDTHVDLINVWCTETTELLTDFTSAGTGEATSVIEAFKFYNNNAVYLFCDLLVCPTADGCVTSCGGSSGKRSLEEPSDGMEAPHHAAVGAYLRIMDPYSSAPVNVPGLLLLIAALISTLEY